MSKIAPKEVIREIEDTTHGDADHCCVPKCLNKADVSYSSSLQPGHRWWLCSTHHAAVGFVFEVTDGKLSDWSKENKLRTKIGMLPTQKMSTEQYVTDALSKGVPKAWLTPISARYPEQTVSVSDLLP